MFILNQWVESIAVEKGSRVGWDGTDPAEMACVFLEVPIPERPL